MIKIDKTDELYKFLTKLGVDDIEETYTTLANLGRYKRNDVLKYFRAEFEPSLTNEVGNEELEEIVDYYADLRQITKLKAKEVQELIKQYTKSKDDKIKELIVQYYLKDVMYLCLNYKTLHRDVNLQDLIQIANIGLIQALENYNSDSKLKFDDYIIYYVYKNVTEEYKEKK